MTYDLRNCRNGESAVYPTTVDITEKDGVVTFLFHSETTQYFCPHDHYNGIHSEGDACEILIGTDPERKYYYEMEVSAEGLIMLAKMTNHGFDESGEQILDIEFIDTPFITGGATKTESGYDSYISFRLDDVRDCDGEIYFNAFRQETDGGERYKHLFALSPTFRPRFHATEKFVWLRDYLK